MKKSFAAAAAGPAPVKTPQQIAAEEAAKKRKAYLRDFVLPRLEEE